MFVIPSGACAENLFRRRKHTICLHPFLSVASEFMSVIHKFNALLGSRTVWNVRLRRGKNESKKDEFNWNASNFSASYSYSGKDIVLFPSEFKFARAYIDHRLYLQLTDKVTIVSNRSPSGMARFHTTHRYLAPSSSRRGSTDRVLVVCKSFDPPLLIGACRGVLDPKRYHLFRRDWTFRFDFSICVRTWYTYVMVGSGEPPMLLQVRSNFLSSVATAIVPGATSGGCGGVRTVRL